MKVSNIDIIKEEEKLVLYAYMPTKNDVWTIGYGHTKGVKQGDKITPEQAEVFLREDLADAENCVKQNVKVPLTQNQFDALVSLVFNIGGGNFRGSTVLRKLNAKDYAGAADAFLMWNKQRNKVTKEFVVLNGLVKRRKRERELFNA